MEPCEDQDIHTSWALQSILQILRTQGHTPCLKEFLARMEREQEVSWSAAKANAFGEHWCIMHILLFPLCRILTGFPAKKKKKNTPHMNILGLSDCCKCTIWMGWAHRMDVTGAGWNPRQMPDVPNSHSHDLHSETQGLAEETWGNINLPHFSLFFSYLEVLQGTKTSVLKKDF